LEVGKTVGKPRHAAAAADRVAKAQARTLPAAAVAAAAVATAAAAVMGGGDVWRVAVVAVAAAMVLGSEDEKTQSPWCRGVFRFDDGRGEQVEGEGEGPGG